MIRGYQITRRIPGGYLLKVSNDYTGTRDFVGQIVSGSRTLAIYGITETSDGFDVYRRDSLIGKGLGRLSEAVSYIVRDFTR